MLYKYPRYGLLFCFILLIGGCKKKIALPDLRESYSAKDTRPFGGNIAFHILENCFPENYVQVKKQPFEDIALGSPDTSSIYFCLTKNFHTNSAEAESILDYVYKGNTFFLASSNIDSVFLKKLYCKATSPGDNYIPPYFRRSSLRLVEGVSDSINVFSYFYRPFTGYFPELNEDYSRIMGYNSNDQPNCIVFFWGKGKMFLHTDPRAFSNYFLLKDNNYLYMINLLQLMDEAPQHVYWDDFYGHSGNDRNSGRSFSTLSEIMKHPPLVAAFWISLLILLLYILFGMKRKQRIIKEITPNQNSSVAFTETIARLYLQQNDNKNIAEKMITYFNEYIRSNYFLHANPGSDDFIQALSRKSGVSLDKTVSLYRAINHASQNEKLDDYQLLSLNEQIQQFYKKRK